MPYTPPAQRSPATSKPNSPIITRNHSYSEQGSVKPKLPQKPALPRSVSSTSYLTKHRRSPSISTQANTAANGQVTGTAEDARRGQGSFGNGDVTTPPDSDEEERQRGRVREIGDGNLEELERALQNIEMRKEHSPNREDAAPPVVTAVATAIPPHLQSLSAEARKISHSRSSSEIMLSKHVAHIDTAVMQTSSSENSDNEDELRIKPPLLRKKSGELVKPALRPASRRRPSSMPGTPTYSKAVHFNENMEQVRHFLQVDRPMAVSAGSSPVETYDSESDYPFGYDDGYRSNTVEWEIKLANFPGETFERKSAPVRLERLFLASDHKTLVGTVAVANLSFHKSVVARFTLDYWKTTSEVNAEYNQDVRKKQANDGYDRFNFNIKLADQANLESKTLFLCVRYNVNGQEYWDNNTGMNFQVDFTKKTKPKGNSSRGGHGLGSIPRSRHSPTASRGRSMPPGNNFDDDFGHALEFSSGRGSFRDSPSSSIRLKPKSKQRASMYPDQSSRRGPQAFSARYDFSASLTAALSTAQNALGDRSGIRPVEKKTPTADVPVPGTKPAVASDKPPLQSAEYNELIQKFCFFGTPTGKSSPKGSTPARNDSLTDGTDDKNSSGSGSGGSSAASSPLSPTMPLSVDGANDSRPNYFSSRSSSPGPITGAGPDDLLNSSFQQHGYSMHGGIFPDRSHTPQVRV